MSEPSPPCVRGAPGFRFSVIDGAVIVAAVAASAVFWNALGNLALLFPIVVAHFFLFCNVFRVRRSLELIWAAVFVVNFSAWSVIGNFSWWPVLLVQTPVTAACIVLEIRSPGYHGIGCARIGRLSAPR
jgi:hypothetical protein